MPDADSCDRFLHPLRPSRRQALACAARAVTLRAARGARGLLASLALALALTPAAAEARTIAPPGNSGVEQYVEVVPGAEGNVPVGSDGHRGHTLTPSQRKRLQESGSEGSALAAFAEATGAQTKRSNGEHARKRGGKGGHGGAEKPNVGTGGSVATDTVKAATLASQTGSGGGLGIGLPIALGAIALAGLLAFLLRRRSS